MPSLCKQSGARYMSFSMALFGIHKLPIFRKAGYPVVRSSGTSGPIVSAAFEGFNLMLGICLFLALAHGKAPIAELQIASSVVCLLHNVCGSQHAFSPVAFTLVIFDLVEKGLRTGAQSLVFGTLHVVCSLLLLQRPKLSLREPGLDRIWTANSNQVYGGDWALAHWPGNVACLRHMPQASMVVLRRPRPVMTLRELRSYSTVWCCTRTLPASSAERW